MHITLSNLQLTFRRIFIVAHIKKEERVLLLRNVSKKREAFTRFLLLFCLGLDPNDKVTLHYIDMTLFGEEI